MVALRHKRSAVNLISTPVPGSSSNMVFDSPEKQSPDRAWTAREAMSLGYSPLFAQGLCSQSSLTSPALSAFPSPPPTPPNARVGRAHDSGQSSRYCHPVSENRPSERPSPPQVSPVKVSPSKLSPVKTTARRRRSSAMHTTPMSASPQKYKAVGTDNGVEHALDNVMKSLKVMAMGTPTREESRWSSSSEESFLESEETGFWRPRKSGESTRSKVTIGTMKSSKSTKSLRSKKSHRSEDTDRMDLDLEDIPPVPVAPTTPGRSRRMMNGLVKRLGLTPKKSSANLLGLPPPPPSEPTTPRLRGKSSLSTLRSVITKKASVTTLRSVRTTKSSHPFAGVGPTMDCEAVAPPLPPRWRENEFEAGCMPVTPRRRTPKSSIGPPRLQPSTSPSTFLKDMPRPAPTTPKASDPSMSPTTDLLDEFNYGTPRLDTSSNFDTPTTQLDTPVQDDDDAVEIITFSTPPPLTMRSAQGSLKPKRLLDLLPKQQRVNMGLQTPPCSGILQKKKSTMAMRMPFSDKTNMSAQGPVCGSTPDNISAVLSKAEKTYRGPFGFVRRAETNTPSPSLSLRVKQPVGSAWPVPATQPLSSDYPTFGAPSPTGIHRPRPSIPDFTASPNTTLDLSDISLDSATLESIGTFGRRLSDASVESDLPTEEWELEAYLKELDRQDKKRADASAVS